MKRVINIVVFAILFLLTARTGFAQRDSVAKAVITLQDKSLSSEARIKKALEIIDRAIKHPECANDGYSWYVRGFIYKDMYKAFESQNKKSTTRISAVEFLRKSYGLLAKDTAASSNEYRIAIRQTLKFLASTFYNDAGSLLDPVNYQLAITNYEKFKECILVADPGYNVKVQEIEFKLALASVYEKLFRNNIKVNSAFFGKTEELYKQVIALDTNNWPGNYNLSMLYYNYGVDIINQMSVTEDIITIENIQEEARSMFKKALPYALKSHALQPRRREPIIALQGIYFSLYENEKSDEFKAKLEQLDKGK